MGKISPLNLVEKNTEYISMLTMLGQEHECSGQLLTEIEKFLCSVNGQPKYSDINKLRYDTFCKKNQGPGNVLD